MGTYFKFYFPNLHRFDLFAVLICYLNFIMYRRAHNVFGTLWRVSFLDKFVAGGLELGEKRGLRCSKNMLSAMVCLRVFDF